MNTTKGMSLIELLVVLSILSLLIVFNTSHLGNRYHKNQLDLLVDQLTDMVHFSRLQALLQEKTLVLAPCSDSKEWSKGAVLFIDNAQHQYSKSSDMVQQWHWPSSKITIRWKGFQSGNYLIFSDKIQKNATNGTFLIQAGSDQRRLIINRLGRVKKINID